MELIELQNLMLVRKNGEINKGALNRYILSKNELLQNRINELTSFLDPSINNNYDRVFCLLNKITEPKKCKFCEKQIKVSKQYKTYCSIKCTNNCPVHKEKQLKTYTTIDQATGKSSAMINAEKLSIMLNTVDEKTGLTKAQLTGKKTSKTISMVDALTGTTIAKERGKKISKTVMNIDALTGTTIAKERGKKISEHLNIMLETGEYESERRAKMALHTMKMDIDVNTGLNRSQLRAYYGALTKELKNQSVISMLGGKRKEFTTYYRLVKSFTRQSNYKSLPNFDYWGNHATDENAYHLDHKYSILRGFIDNIPAIIIGNIVNLEFIPYKENLKKGYKCSINKNELIANYNASISSPTAKPVDIDDSIMVSPTFLKNG